MDCQQTKTETKQKTAKTQTHNTQQKRTKQKSHQATGIHGHTQERRRDDGGSTEVHLPECQSDGMEGAIIRDSCIKKGTEVVLSDHSLLSNTT